MNSTTDKQAIIVSHTHWDRAWYLPFEKFRYRLIKMIDRLIDLLSENTEYQCFILDGQTILLDDYLEIKPENASILKELISEGKLQIGPWYILPDLFLVSGESIIRNLQIGHSMTEEWGSKMKVGYVPDPFGHIAQLPQILQSFGIDNFLFMRGMPEEVLEQNTLLFNWVAPDGSTVRSYYMIDGYLNASNLGHKKDIGRYDLAKADIDLAEKKIDTTTEKLSGFFPENLFLLNNGMDHMPEQPELPKLIQQLGERSESLTLTHGSFSDFAELLPEVPEHLSYSGNLIGNPNHPILLSVYSTRTYLKQLNQQAQGILEKIAEPISVITASLTHTEVPHHILNYSWKKLLKNHPHDDICGCSEDGVHRDNEVSFRHVLENGESIITDSIETLMKHGFEPAEYPENENQRFVDIFAFNPHSSPINHYFETEIVFPNYEGEEEEVLDAYELKAYDALGNPLELEILDTEAPYLKAEFIQFTWGRKYSVGIKTSLPAIGYQLIRVVETAIPLDLRDNTLVDATLESDRYSISWNDSGLQVRDKDLELSFSDFITFEYVQDNGDTYSFSRASNPIYSTFTGARAGKSKQSIIADFNLVVPEDLNNSRNIDLDISVDINLNNADRIEFEINYKNQAKNGRLRMLLPIGFKTRKSFSDGHFMMYQHEVTPEISAEDHQKRYEQYPGELNYPTHFQGDFCFAEHDHFNTWVANRGNHEYELVDVNNSTHFAITLHRAVGFLSVSNGSIRRPHAGPKISVPDAQCLRAINAHLAWGTTSSNRFEINQQAKQFSHQPKVQQLPAMHGDLPVGTVPRSLQFIAIQDPEVQLSCLKMAESSEDLILRVFNLSNKTIDSKAVFHSSFSSMCSTDFYEQWDENQETPVQSHEVPIRLEPNQIRTIRLRP